jgi:hypothetical protein
MQSSQGTGNLGKGEKDCNARRGVNGDTNKNAQQDLFGSVSRYTPARHRALIALRCASSHRPFNSVADPYYLEEVELLRAGTKVPAPITVSRDVQILYREGAKKVKEYFKVSSSSSRSRVQFNRSTELRWRHSCCYRRLDGPFCGLLPRYCYNLVQCREDSPRHSGVYTVKIFFPRSLKLAQFPQTHGATHWHLAEKTADCLKRFGLDKLVTLFLLSNAQTLTFPDSSIRYAWTMLATVMEPRTLFRCISQHIGQHCRVQDAFRTR